MTRLAIVQNGDEPQLTSTAVMLRHAGYEVKYCGPALRKALIACGCDTVLSVETMYALGYDRVDPSIGEATLRDMATCDLFAEIKVRNVPKIVTRWPRLAGKMLYLRVNGAQPEICPKGGDEVNLPCPILTACLWYGTATYRTPHSQGAICDWQAHHADCPKQQMSEHERPGNQPARDHGPVTLGDNGMAYVCWPPYPRSAEYDKIDRSRLTRYDPPYSLCHSTREWGYKPVVDDCVRLGVRCYGNNSPAGQVHHSRVASIAATALCLVHLKSVDCPGWALYEAMLSGTPVVTGRLLSSRMLAYDLLRDGETCLEYGIPASLEYGRGDMDFPKCLADIEAALERLKDPAENKRIGEAGRQRLNELMWTPARDGDGFRAFMERWFP